MSSALDLDFYEDVIIYHMLTDESYLASVVDIISPGFFTNQNIRAVVGLVTNFYRERDQIPTLTELKAHLTTDALKNSYKAVVSSIQEFDQNYCDDELRDNTERFFKERAVYNTMMDVVDDYKAGDINTSDVLSKFEKACSISIQADKGLDYYNDVDRHIQDLLHEDNTVSTGWGWLDNKLEGGYLENGRAIYVFAGETNIGKSIFLGNTAVNIANTGKTVLLITLEMSELVYAKRISTNITQVPISDLAANTDTLKSQIIQHRNETGGRILIKEFPPSTVTCTVLKSFIKKIVDGGVKIDAIVLDYVNLLTTTTGVNSYERVKYVTERLRALSYVFSCPVITATQLNRSGYNEANPGMETVGESYGLAATADAMFSIWQEEEDAELGLIKLGLMKNRFGPNFGSCTMQIDYPTLTLTQDDSLPEAMPTSSNSDELNLMRFIQDD
jgi:replicative DNA helicase